MLFRSTGSGAAGAPAPGQPAHAHGHDQTTPGHAHEHEHGEGWKPKDGLERFGFTALATVATAVAVSFLLLAAMSVAATLAVGGVALAQQAEPAAAPAADAAAAPAAPAVAAAPAAEAAPAAGLAADAKVEQENIYGPERLWAEGDIVSHGTTVVLVIMSMGTWFILFTRLWDQTKLMGQAKTVKQKFWTAGSLKEGMNKLEKNSAYRSMVEDGLRASEHHDGKMTDRIDLNEWVTMSLQRSYDAISSEMQEGLAFLASVGSTAPFVGLLGTVWGIIKALITIAAAGQIGRAHV